VPASPARDAAAPRALTGLLVVLGAATLFGMLGPLSRFAYEAGLTPTAFVAWRACIGLATLGLVIVWRVRRGTARLLPFRALPVRARVALLVAATAGFTLNLAMFIAFDRVTVALALLGFYTYPAMVAVVGILSGREPLDRPRGLALALALGGMAAVVASQLDPGAGIRLDAVGIGLALGAALSQTVYVTVSREGYRQVPTEQAIFTVLLVTTIGATVLALLVDGVGSLLAPLADPGVIPLLLFTGTFAAAIPSLGFLYGIRAIGGLRAGILMLWEPVVGVALAAVLLDEAVVPIQVLGAAGILAAAGILQRSAAADHLHRRAPASPAARDEDDEADDDTIVVPAGS
jgi:drug/metabolite transporter (DMT)-like permease